MNENAFLVRVDRTDSGMGDGVPRYEVTVKCVWASFFTYKDRPDLSADTLKMGVDRAVNIIETMAFDDLLNFCHDMAAIEGVYSLIDVSDKAKSLLLEWNNQRADLVEKLSDLVRHEISPE